jgi:hypothetical protein
MIKRGTFRPARRIRFAYVPPLRARDKWSRAEMAAIIESNDVYWAVKYKMNKGFDSLNADIDAIREIMYDTNEILSKITAEAPTPEFVWFWVVGIPLSTFLMSMLSM